jgi:predicted O-methyltransferase YrrM
MLINVGKEKGEFLDQIIKDANPQVAVELGAFVGYRY